MKTKSSTRTRSIASSEPYQKTGNEENATRFVRLGLLTLRVESLEKEIIQLSQKMEASRKRIAELPGMIRKSERMLAETITDQKTLENLESRSN